MSTKRHVQKLDAVSGRLMKLVERKQKEVARREAKRLPDATIDFFDMPDRQVRMRITYGKADAYTHASLAHRLARGIHATTHALGTKPTKGPRR
jgi:hypothetical protein